MSSEAQATMATALQNLSVAWQEVRASWRDAKAVEFEERYLKGLPGEMAQAGTVMAEIEKLLQKAKHDCG